MPTPTHTLPTCSLADYAADSARGGTAVLAGTGATYWMRYEGAAMMRVPIFELAAPALHEVERVLWRSRAAVASYLLAPDEDHPANAYLYLCCDPCYALEKLEPPMRRNVRRGLQALTIAPLTLEQLAQYGVQAYGDTRRRAGLSDGTPTAFAQRLLVRAGMPESVLLGAWYGETLAAFLTIIEVDDWAEIGCYSRDDQLALRPNDTLMYSVLLHYLVERKFRLVSYGVSSVQAESSAAGLHRFKLKVGFEAHPVHRAFVPHPLLRPLFNRSAYNLLHQLLTYAPTNRRLKKAEGMLGALLGKEHLE